MNLLLPAPLDSMFILASKTLEGWQKLIGLNLQATRLTPTDAQERILEALPFNDPRAALVLQMSLIGPLAEKIQTYERDLYGIVASTQAELAAAPGTQSKRTIGTSRPLSTVS
jgi:phasin family protein